MVRSDPKEAERLAVGIVRKHVPDRRYRIFLFGSRASGNARERSDIDVGVEGPEPLPHETLTAIQEDIEEAPTLYSIDVVDFKRVPEKFKHVATKRVALEEA